MCCMKTMMDAKLFFKPTFIDKKSVSCTPWDQRFLQSSRATSLYLWTSVYFPLHVINVDGFDLLCWLLLMQQRKAHANKLYRAIFPTHLLRLLFHPPVYHRTLQLYIQLSVRPTSARSSQCYSLQFPLPGRIRISCTSILFDSQISYSRLSNYSHFNIRPPLTPAT
jgi:hypothetical protein